jgi:predicted dehydrogenase
MAYGTHKTFADTTPYDDTHVAIMKFPGNIIGKVFISISCKRDYTMRSVFYGTEGTISCPQFWKARTCTLSAEREEVFSSSFRSEFTFEIQTFIDRIQKGIIQNQESEEISIRVLEILSG